MSRPAGDSPRSFLRAWLLLMLYPVGTLVAAGVFGDRLILQKAIVHWVYPIGCIYLLAAVLGAAGWRLRSRAVMAAAAGLLTICLASTTIPSRFATETLESRYSEIDVDAAFDAVAVLGGGTGLTPEMRPQLSGAGERLAAAARLYHAGRIKRVIVTGTALQDMPNVPDSPSEQGVILLREFDLPAEVVTTLPGRTTSGEMESIREYLSTHSGQRIGVVTSALHMPRAMRLAADNGLTLTPVPVDFRSYRGPLNALSFIPDVEGLDLLTAVFHEYLGMLAGR